MLDKARCIIDDTAALERALARVREAQRAFATFDQKQVDKIFFAAASAANQQRIPLAKQAVSETGMGIVEDKVIKNNYAAEYIYNAYKDVKTCGVIEEDAAFGIQKIAEPIGVIAAVITVIICAKVKRLNAPQIFDTVALAILNGQMLGRWGNFFNREAFGEYTDSLFAMQLPLDAVRNSDVTETMRANMQVVDGVSYIQVHPTFLYESVWCLILFILLFLYRKHKKYEGELFLLYLFGYGLGRVWIEGLRTDQLLIPGIGFPVSQLLAGLIVVVTGGLLIYLWRNHKRMPFLRSGRKYEPLPDKPVGKKRPKAKDRLFK